MHPHIIEIFFLKQEIQNRKRIMKAQIKIKIKDNKKRMMMKKRMKKITDKINVMIIIRMTMMMRKMMMTKTKMVKKKMKKRRMRTIQKSMTKCCIQTII
jgi:hypothetical protein